MKKTLLAYICLLPLYCFAQSIITTTWHQNLFDTLKLPKNTWSSCFPFSVSEFGTNKDVFLLTYDYGAWSLRRVSKGSGEIIWQTAKTHLYPDSSGFQYYPNDMFINREGNIEVHGVKSDTYGISGTGYTMGDPIIITYDINTGKEIRTIVAPTLAEKFYIRYANSNTFLRKKNGNGYYTLSLREVVAPIPKSDYLFLSVDSNLVYKDTLVSIAFNDDIDSISYDTGIGFVKPTLIKDHVYLPIQVRKQKLDTATFQILLYKIDVAGNIKFRKKLGVPLYNYLKYGSIYPISDGFIVSGNVDTSYLLFQNTAKATNTSMVAKIDTNGVIAWKSFLKFPKEIKQFDFLESTEDAKRGGYWTAAGSFLAPMVYLYYTSKEGKSSFIAAIKLDNNSKKFVPVRLWSQASGDLSLGYRYTETIGEVSSAYIPSSGLTYIPNTALDAALLTSLPDVLPDFLVKVYPNPATDILHINITDSEDVLEATFFDMNGRAVQSQAIQAQCSINIAAWHSGLYAYILRDQYGRIVKSSKIIKL